MNDSLRKSFRLQKKEKERKTLSCSLRSKSCKDSEEDKEVTSAYELRSVDDFDLDTIIRKPANDFLRVHNSYCSDDRVKYDGYDPDFIDDGDVYSSSSQEDVRERVNSRSRVQVLESRSGSEMELNDLEIDERETNLFETPVKEIVRGGKNGLKREKPQSSDDEIKTSTRKQKISVLSSSSDSNSENDLTIMESSQRTPSLRSLKVQARVNADRDDKFANFKANRLRSKKVMREGMVPVSSISNLGLIKQTLRNEAGVLPTAHQGLCENRELFGEDSDSSSIGEDTFFHTSYIEALDYTKQIVGDGPMSSKSNQTGVSQPVMFEFSEDTPVVDYSLLDPDSDSEISLKQQLLHTFGSNANKSTPMDSEYDIDDLPYPALLAVYDVIDEVPVLDMTDTKVHVDECDILEIPFSDELDCSIMSDV